MLGGGLEYANRSLGNRGPKWNGITVRNQMESVSRLLGIFS